MIAQQTEKFDAVNRPTENQKRKLATFLYEHLEQYGDALNHIRAAMEYATKERASFGGFILCLSEGKQIVGAVVVNETGMGGYIPENILVYIATHRDYRGKGIGKRLMEETITYAKGAIALHVEKDNPAKALYEKYGFTNPYLEMRLKR